MNDPMAELVDRLAAMDARVRLLEGGTRTGLGSIRSAWGTAAADPTVFAAFESGPVGSTWLDDKGATGTGYPVVTIVNCPTRYMILWAARPTGLANAATYRSIGVQITVAVDGVDIPSLPNARRLVANSNVLPVDAAQSAIVVRSQTPGTHTFQMRALWDDTVPAAPNQPRLTDLYLGVLPLSVA